MEIKTTSTLRNFYESYRVKVNRKIADEPWNDFSSYDDALGFLLKNYGNLAGINFLMDYISIVKTVVVEYDVDFES